MKKNKEKVQDEEPTALQDSGNRSEDDDGMVAGGGHSDEDPEDTRKSASTESPFLMS